MISEACRQPIILLVGNRSDVLPTLSACLSREGWKLLLASSREQAFMEVVQGVPDLIVFDALSSEIHEIDICQRLKSSKQTRDIPIILLTDFEHRERKTIAVESEGIDYVTSPFKPQDVVERVKLHLTLRNLQQQFQLNEARYYAIIEDQTELLCRYRPDGTLTFVNAAYCRAWGKTPDTLLGRSLLSLFTRAIDLDVMGRLLHADQMMTFEGEVVLGDGTFQWQQWVVKPIRDSQGEIVEYQGVGRDITRLKQAEFELQRHQEHLEALVAKRTAELETSERQYRLLAEQVADGIGIIHHDVLMFCNHAWQSLFGFSAKYLAQTPFPDLFHQEDRQRIHDMFLQLQQQTFVPPWQARCITADRRTIWIEGRSSLSVWQGQNAILTTIRDITASKHQELMLTQERNHLKQENITLRASLRDRYKFGEIVGRSQAMQEIYEVLIHAAASDANIVICGESGTGKELAARTIHQLGQRRSQAFVAVNCGAIPEPLFEREFFGHRKGSFTGAMTNQPGYLDRAHNGTLFLDEVGELTPVMQVKLLRTLQDGEYTPIGSTESKRANIRIIAATNKDLKELLRKGVMREDFFYRIRVIVITLPPLRKRKEDIPLLLDHFLRQYGRKTLPDISALPAQIIELFDAYDWPGNVRELQNELQRYVAGQPLEFLENMPTVRCAHAHASNLPIDANGLTFHEAVEAFEKHLICATLEQYCGHQGKTARRLGIPPRTLYEKIKKYHLKSDNA